MDNMKNIIGSTIMAIGCVIMYFGFLICDKKGKSMWAEEIKELIKNK